MYIIKEAIDTLYLLLDILHWQSSVYRYHVCKTANIVDGLLTPLHKQMDISSILNHSYS